MHAKRPLQPAMSAIQSSLVHPAALVRDWAHAALAGLGEARAEIDALNVFPVPDGDTGTNVYLTMEAACAGIEEALAVDGSGPSAAMGLARGSLLGARGNSGVILSQILRGTAEVLAAIPSGRSIRGTDIAAMLERGSELAYSAVARPVEGTILTVARAAARAARAASSRSASDSPAEAAGAASDGAAEALEQTPTLLESLRVAGVVDAGGRALVVVLDALVEVVTGSTRVPTARRAGHLLPTRPTGHLPAIQLTGAPSDCPAFEVMYLLDADEAAVGRLRAELELLGDSLVVSGSAPLWNVHVHVDDPGAAVEAGIEAGRPHRIRITALDREAVGQDQPKRAIVAVTHGPGTAELLRGAGVITVPAPPNTRPSTAELLSAVLASDAGEVILLPSDGDTRAVAGVVAAEARAGGVRVSVIPTRAIVQSLAAAAVHDPSAAFEEDVVAMTRAAGATRYAAVTVATRDVLTTAGPCRVGDILGLVDGDISAVGEDAALVARELLNAMLAAGGELVTLVFGCDIDPPFGDELTGWLAAVHPMVEVVAYDGGQPLWPVIIGVE
jgi:DAK2 domain fusion protein YloV